MGDDSIFDDEGEPKSNVQGQDEQTVNEDLGKQNSDYVAQKPSRRTQLLIGFGIFVIIGVLIFLAFTGIIDVTNGTESKPFDETQCQFGVTTFFFETRCMTLEEFEEMEKEKEDQKPITPITEKPTTGGDGGTKDVSSTSDKVEIEKSNDPIGYYIITTDGDWYGDYIDIRKIPSKIEKSGSMKINFMCYTDKFAGTSTYFGTFRNVIDNNLTVEVFINGIEVQSKSTEKNQALILEGTCYGHDS